MNTLKPLIFPVDSVAHLQGHEPRILPLTDELKRCYFSIQCTTGDAAGHDTVVAITDFDGQPTMQALVGESLKDVLWDLNQNTQYQFVITEIRFR